MSLKLTPEMLERMYEYLRASPPFCRWSMPDSDDIEFRVSRDSHTDGKCFARPDGGHGIIISDTRHAYTASLAATMAHEMIHVYVDRKHGIGRKPDHGKEFKQAAQLVCKYHGFDPLSF